MLAVAIVSGVAVAYMLFSQTKIDRRFLHAGEIDRFVKRAVIDRSVAEEADGHLVDAAGARAEPQADRAGDAAADETVGAEQAVLLGIDVHAAAAAAATAADLGVQLGHHLMRAERPWPGHGRGRGACW